MKRASLILLAPMICMRGGCIETIYINNYYKQANTDNFVNSLYILKMIDAQHNQDQTEDYSDLFKLVIIGDTSVGKTHLLHRFVKGQLPKSAVPTIGVEFATKTVTLKDGGKVKA